jgi:predicted AAA+ superfamily ATPase
MSELEKLFLRANELLEKLESAYPSDLGTFDIADNYALRWRYKNKRSYLEPIRHTSSIALDDLKCIDKQIESIAQNTKQFLHKLPANNALLSGPRGTGKSSLVKAILNEFKGQGLRLIEVEREHLNELHDICDAIDGLTERFIIFCDDLSFESNDSSYKALKVILDGSVSTTPENVLIYATSNRRHLMPEYMSENREAKLVEGELHLGESTEEKISLSERFGLWLSFHPFSQAQYLEIIDYWINKLEAPVESQEEMQKEALRWALQHGSRSGRTAWQFARDWTGKNRLKELEP